LVVGSGLYPACMAKVSAFIIVPFCDLNLLSGL